MLAEVVVAGVVNLDVPVEVVIVVVILEVDV
jgi:hypothetical protein